MLKKIFLLITLSFLLVLPNVNAATLAVSIEDLDSLYPDGSDGIIGSNIDFGVTGDWDFAASYLGENTDTISWSGTGNVSNWLNGANLVESTLSTLLFDYTFGDYFLTDGLLFTLYYPDDVTLTLQLTSLEFSTLYNGLVSFNASETTFGSGDNELVFSLSSSSAPEPSSFLLLFTGLCSLAGLTRWQR